jgi:hypothetical protein
MSIKSFYYITFLSLLTHQICIFVDGKVWRSPNADDQTYWREYGENHLKRILNSQKIKGVNQVAKNVVFFVGGNC